MEEAEARNRALGVRAVFWWIRQGLQPTVALVKRHWWSGRYEVVSDALSQTDVNAIVNGTRTENVPEYEMAVVESVSDDDLRRLVYSSFLEAQTLEDWTRLNDANPAGPTFQRFPEGWGVKLWHRESKEYRYVRFSVIDEPLNQIHRSLEANQARALAQDVEQKGAGTVRTVKDTAWIGSERIVWVFNDRGRFEFIDFGKTAPRVLPLGPSYGGPTLDSYTLVRAADVPTYKELSKHHWRRKAGESIGQYGTTTNYEVFANAEGLAYVRTDDLVSP
jgi:hypothetical protein